MTDSASALPGHWQDHAIGLFEHSTAVVVGAFRVDGTVIYANPGMADLLRATPVQAPAVHTLMSAPRFDTLATAAPQTDPVYEGWLTFGTPEQGYQSIRGRVWRGGTGDLLIIGEHDVAQLATVNQAITDLNGQVTNLQREVARQKAELQATLDELRETQTMLIQSEKMSALGQMVAGVAHEINNPIAFVHSNLHSLRLTAHDITGAYHALAALVESCADDDLLAALETVRREADLDFALADLDDLLEGTINGVRRVKHLVETLRTFSHLDEADFKTVNVKENVESALMIAAPHLRDRITVVLELDDLPPLRCHPAELNQVFLNLIVNAAQAIEDRGTITIRGEEQGDALKLTFSDTGQGIPPDVTPRIFDPFFTTKPVGAGTGLGLSIVHKIIHDRHAGSITVDSTPGAGTTFTLLLPKDPPDDPVQPS